MTIGAGPRASIPGSTARQATSAVSRLAEIISVPVAPARTRRSRRSGTCPATFTSPSTGPSSAAASAEKAEKSSSLAASAGRPHAVRPAPARSLISAPSPSSLTSVTASRAPCSARREHTSRPIVPAAPVTTTTRFSSRMRSSVSGSGHPGRTPAAHVHTAVWPSGLAAARVQPRHHPAGHLLLARPGRARDHSRRHATKWSSHLIAQLSLGRLSRSRLGPRRPLVSLRRELLPAWRRAVSRAGSSRPRRDLMA